LNLSYLRFAQQDWESEMKKLIILLITVISLGKAQAQKINWHNVDFSQINLHQDAMRLGQLSHLGPAKLSSQQIALIEKKLTLSIVSPLWKTQSETQAFAILIFISQNLQTKTYYFNQLAIHPTGLYSHIPFEIESFTSEELWLRNPQAESASQARLCLDRLLDQNNSVPLCV
jgi:hypothetical protein